jgi:hypothetical protein
MATPPLSSSLFLIFPFYFFDDLIEARVLGRRCAARLARANGEQVWLTRGETDLIEGVYVRTDPVARRAGGVAVLGMSAGAIWSGAKSGHGW